MLPYVVAWAVLYGTVSFTGAGRVLSVRVDPENLTDAVERRQTFNSGDPNFNNGNDEQLRYTSNESTIMGLSTVSFAITLIGVALFIFGGMIWIFYRLRKKTQRLPDPEFAFKANWMATVPAPPPVLPPAAPTPLDDQQTAAIPHYGDTHTAPDVLVQTRDGLQLLPGSTPPREKGTASRPFWRGSGGSGK
ncbi:hypothetical protein B0H14DRAFT_2822535 [Mycena olivaceomarginata]|nr:hypothetical protein B0H14DRAFT_2822535 [Mycena olivaceomarginata]